MQGGPPVLPMLCEVTFVKLSVMSQKQYHVHCFLLGRFEKDLLHTVYLSSGSCNQGTVIKFQGGGEPYSWALQHGTFDQ